MKLFTFFSGFKVVDIEIKEKYETDIPILVWMPPAAGSCGRVVLISH